MVVDTLVAEIVVDNIATVGFVVGLFVATTVAEVLRPKFSDVVTRVDTDCAMVVVIAVDPSTVYDSVAVVGYTFDTSNTAVGVVAAGAVDVSVDADDVPIAVINVTCVFVDGDVVVEVVVVTVDINDSVLGTVTLATVDIAVIIVFAKVVTVASVVI